MRLKKTKNGDVKMKKVVYEEFCFYLILAEERLQIDVPFAYAETEEKAENLSDIDLIAVLDYEDKKPCIRVFVEGMDFLYFFDEKVIITEIKPEVELNRIIEKEDMMPSKLTLQDFINSYGVGYKLDYIGYDVR